MRPFACGQCGNTVFFENVSCGQCGALLGFSPALRRMLAFDPPPPAPAPWRARASAPAQPGPPSSAAGNADAGLLRPCANRLAHQLCNWVLDAGDEHSQCRSCRLTVAIPNLQEPLNLARWQLFEKAKRRLVFTLLTLGLPPEAQAGAAGASFGLRFQLLANLPDQPPVMTGHDDGLITLNLAEADDVQREAARVSLGELVLNQWLPVAQFLNAMSRSLGLADPDPDPYPYQMPDAVLAKMALVQTLLREAALPPLASAPLAEPLPT